MFVHREGGEGIPGEQGRLPAMGSVVLQSPCPVRLFSTPRTVARQAPLSTGFSRQEHWSGLSFPSPGDLPDTGIEAMSPMAGRFFTSERPRKPNRKSTSYETCLDPLACNSFLGDIHLTLDLRGCEL